MNLLRIPNFISLEEAQELSSWVLHNKSAPFFSDAQMGGNRVTTRYADNDVFNYPEILKSIRTKIIELFGLADEERFGFYPPFKDGVVASCAFPGDTCYEHTDPVWYSGFNTMHCNVITQAPEGGGELTLGGVLEPMPERELCCYLPSKTPHSTDLVTGSRERIMWIFGFCITDDDWQKLHEKH